MKPMAGLRSFVLIAAFSLGLHAESVISHPVYWTTNNSVGFAAPSGVDGSQNGNRAYDNFSVTTSSTFNRATWYGVYINQNGTNGSVNTDNWSITIYRDNSGAPNFSPPAIADYALTAAQVTVTNLCTPSTTCGSLLGQQLVVYKFVALLPSAFTVGAGNTAWFSPMSLSNSSQYPNFRWIRGTGGDGQYYATTVTGGIPDTPGTLSSNGDLAFTLDLVPEPSTYVLFASGLAMLGFIRRRR